MPQITVAIPFHNAEITLGDAIRSVFAQTYREWELLLLDDGSTDGSLTIARKVQDGRVSVWTDGVNRGLSSRLNQAALQAASKYLARMDADDLMHPRRLERQVAYMDGHPDVDAVDTGAYSLDAHGEPRGVYRLPRLDTQPTSVLRHGLMFHASLLARTEWFRANPYDSDFCRAEDRELWCRTCATSMFGRIREPLYYVREHGGSVLRKYLATSRTCRKILRLYGPGFIGRRMTGVLILGSYYKSGVYFAASLLRLTEALVRRRSGRITAAERTEAMSGLSSIFATRVPGLDNCE